MRWQAWGRGLCSRDWLQIVCAYQGTCPGKIRLRHTATAAIRWRSHCSLSEQEAGLEWDFAGKSGILIPVAEYGLYFPAIAEELGVIFALCLILVCVSCYVMFLNIAMEIRNRFYKLIALGLGTCYIFQVFLTIGGVTKFIPSTGVTLPLVSYGGSSMLSTMIMFGIIQGLYIIREDERKRSSRREKRESK